jgi:hypothetical protein
VWGAVIGSTLPEIFWRESGHKLSVWFVTAESACILLAALAAIWVAPLRKIARFLVAVAILNFAWGFVSPSFSNLPAVQAATGNLSWSVRFLLSRTFTLSGALIVSLTLIGSGITRRDLFLCIGNPAAFAAPIPFLGLRKPVSWAWLGPAAILVFALALTPYLYLTVHPDFSVSARIIRALPCCLAVATLNAASEEFQFRSVLLAHLRGVFSPSENILLTAAFFGIGHYYGKPGGTTGALMAGFAGWIWARSMIDTRGGVWAFLIHMIQDVVIFAFLVVGAGG